MSIDKVREEMAEMIYNNTHDTLSDDPVWGNLSERFKDTMYRDLADQLLAIETGGVVNVYDEGEEMVGGTDLVTLAESDFVQKTRPETFADCVREAEKS